ncbi:Zinc dependent phospholipase C [Desulfomicrobium norvegicum]|uniref:Zinc dependent phospholipase C n=1 Tax=Desulfomicrobium norvegicum (strain DSM 1741 / NCIMB 8310) TaxID=52561 RepID=A0A8G2C381_DESNO|nr:zinc dependent phospholipase C family protein [Desulfomicrobium norvegicum]SFL77937.1 Zinc dependent phospholipase C [Desulfomicrobium norvegicum]
MALLFAFLLLILLPGEALAWGPGVHMAIGNHVLTHLHLLAPAVAAVLTAHPEQFLYGCLSADIFIGKGSKFTPSHSHNWDTGKALLRQAEDGKAQAYAYGYLSHLAADVIAHNYLVPNMLGFSAGRGKFAHTYVEMLADLQVEWPRKQASRIFRIPHPEADDSLVLTMGQKKLPFSIKKRIFRQSLHLVEEKSYKRSLRMFRGFLPFARKKAFIAEAIAHAQNLVMDLLRNPQRSPVLECDPIGSQNLDQVRRFQRKQRSYYTARGEGIIFPMDTRLEPCLQVFGGTDDRFSQFSE